MTFCDPALVNVTDEWYTHLMGQRCAPTQTCKSWGGPSYGFLGFDNMGLAFLTIFQCTTMEGWADVMYMIWEVWGPLCTVYFVVLVVACSFIMLNLLLAVIIENFQNPSEEAETPEDDTEGDVSPRPGIRQLRQLAKASQKEDDELAGAMAVNECNTPPPLVSIPENRNRNKEPESANEDRSMVVEGSQSPTMYSQAINPNQPHHHARTTVDRQPSEDGAGCQTSDDITVSQEILLPASPDLPESMELPPVKIDNVNPLETN